MPTKAPHGTTGTATSGAASAQKRILVVDDEPDMLDLLCSVIRAAPLGAHVEGASSPLDALAIDERDPVDLLVTDYVMPSINGLELAKRFRTRHPSLPIILLTAFPESSVQNEAFVARVNVFMKKPVDPREFLREVQRAIGPP